MSGQISQKPQMSTNKSPRKMFCQYFKARRKQIIIAAILLIVGLVVGALFTSPLERSHYVAHSLIYVALCFNCWNTIKPLWKRRHKEDDSFHLDLICSIGFFAMLLVYPISLVVLCFLSHNNIISWLPDLISISLWHAVGINFPFVLGGLAFFYRDVREGDIDLAWIVDMPFSIAVALVFIFSAGLRLFGGTAMDNYTLGIGSGGLTLHLIVANIIAPEGKLDLPSVSSESLRGGQ